MFIKSDLLIHLSFEYTSRHAIKFVQEYCLQLYFFPFGKFVDIIHTQIYLQNTYIPVYGQILYSVFTK